MKNRQLAEEVEQIKAEARPISDREKIAQMEAVTDQEEKLRGVGVELIEGHHFHVSQRFYLGSKHK